MLRHLLPLVVDRLGDLVVGFGSSGGNAPMKQWSRENFLELGRWLELKGYGVSSRFGDITDQVQPTDW